jgi:cytochrome c
MCKGKLLAFGMTLFMTMALASGSAFAGDAAEGQKIFNAKCKVCHTAAQNGKNSTGPNLFGVVGRKAGGLPSFEKYKGLQGADFVWDEANLDEFLVNPKKFFKKVSGNNSVMSIINTRNPSQRADLIAHLKTLK